jgi:hypothetical protein
MGIAALLVALVSFAYLAYQIETQRADRQHAAV